MVSLNIEGLSIKEEEDDGGFCFDVGEVGDESCDLQWCLVRRFLCDKLIHLRSMKVRVAGMWRPVQ